MLKIRLYKQFQDEFAQLSSSQQGRLNTFFEQVAGYNEDDKDQSLLDLCAQRGIDQYSVPFGDGWRLYWGFERKVASNLTLKFRKITGVVLNGMYHFPERERE